MTPPATIRDICGAIGASCAEPPDQPVSGVSTDTRSLRPGDLFFALRGERFDGHRFIGAAVQAGASAVVVESLDDPSVAGAAPVLEVGDTLLALQRLARWHRDRLDAEVIAITGSNGKTTTKDFTAGVLRRKLLVSATRGNLNNHIGLPLSVLAAGAEHRATVWELGMNHAGEIAPLCEICRPTIGIITNIGTAHIEFLGTREGIAEEKGALARALPKSGTLVVSAGCDFVEYFRRRTHAKVLAVGNGRGQVRAENLESSPGRTRFRLVIEGDAPAEVELPVGGRHMVSNALLAAGAASVLGLSAAEIAAGLAEAEISGGRLTRSVRRGVEILDDSYNANPESVAAALETLAELPVLNGGRRIAVLGHMAELGAFAEEAHRKVGQLTAERGLQLVAVGELARPILEGAHDAGGQAEHFIDAGAAADWLGGSVREGDAVLFKGSRAAAVETVLKQAFPEED
jgi:UDP-N-acetylmuramoyl-tripeptide--D-alanyl-D-alanine ligase